MLEREENKHSFVIYRLPQSPTLHYGKIAEYKNLDEVNSGFVFTQFYNSELKGFTLSHEAEYQNVEELDFLLKNISVEDTEELSTSYNSYKTAFNRIKHEISSTEIDKVVLSKITFTKDISAPKVFSLFKSYLIKFPNAFVSIIYLENESIWCGASPELFLKVDDGCADTIALASTRKDNGFGAEPDWNEKEIREQWFVQEFVENNLDELGLTYNKTKVESLQSGSLWHLKTSYQFNADMDLSKFTSKMHPTPAVGGTPKRIAIPLIKDVETHDRKYYAGIIGPINKAGNSNLFVNIRCVEIFANGACIYSGGGITAESELESEWEEVNIKAQSLNLI